MPMRRKQSSNKTRVSKHQLNKRKTSIQSRSASKGTGASTIACGITNRSRANEALRESEQRFRQFFELEPNYCYLISLDGKILDVNPSALRALDYRSKSEIVGKPLLTTVYAPACRDKAHQLFLKWRDTGELSNEELSIITQKGEERNVILNVSAVRDAEGKLLHSISIQTDVTKRKRIEEETRNLAKFPSGNPFPVLRINHDGRILYANDASRPLLKDWGVAVNDCVPTFWKSIVTDVLTNVSPKTVDRSLDNRIFSFVAAPVSEMGYVNLYGHDITDHKRAEEQLTYQAKLLTQVNDAIVASDENFILTAWNASAEKLYGWKADEVLGRNALEIVRTEWPGIDADEMRRTRAEKGHWRGEATQIRKDGTRVHVEMATVVLKDENGLITGYVSVNRDITQRKHDEKALSASEAQLSNALEIAHLGPWEYDVGKDLFTFNDHFYRLFRTTAESEGGYTMSSACYSQRFVHPDEMSIVAEEIRKAIESTDPHFSRQLEHRILYADGQTGYISVRFFIVKNTEGRTVKTYGVNQDITERKRAEETIRESEERFRMVFENVLDGISIYEEDPDPSKRKLVECNDRYAVMAGRSREELLKRGITHGLQRTLEDAANNNRLESLVNGRTYRGSFTWIRPDGKDNTIEYVGVPITWRGKSYSIGIDRDITERKRMDEELRHSLAWQEAIFEGSRDAVFIADSQDRFVAVNKAACNLTGYTREELLQMRIPDLHEEVDLAAYKQFRDRILKGESILSEAKIKRKDGTKVDTEFSNSRVVIGGIPFMHTVARDITERNRAEKTLRASEERYRRLFEGDLAGVYFSTPSGKLISCNAAFARIFRFKSVDDALATDTHELYSNPEARQLFLQSVRQNRRLELQESWLKRRDGTDMHVIENVRGVFDDQGELIEIQGYLLDDTERKKSELELKSSHAQLHALAAHLQSVREDERTNLARELHDELGQLLTGLKMQLSVLDMAPTNLDSIQQQDSRNEKIDSMNKLIDKAIGVVRGISLELRPAILDSLGLSAALEWLADDFQQKSGIVCACSIKSDTVFDARCSTAMFRTAQEALTNVGRHSKARKVSITLASEPNEVSLSVRDDGIGMSTEQISDVRSLGLLGIRERAVAIGGTVRIDSIIGKGTTILLRLPLSDKKNTAVTSPGA
jgi:PAS domain S-box-containing protein